MTRPRPPCVRLLGRDVIREALAELVELVAEVQRAEAVNEMRRGLGARSRAVTDYRELARPVDAVSVVVPTQLHREVAGFFLENDVDVLVEKPITPTVAEGRGAGATWPRRAGRILQVGHIERFNPALAAIKETRGLVPRYIESPSARTVHVPQHGHRRRPRPDDPRPRPGSRAGRLRACVEVDAFGGSGVHAGGGHGERDPEVRERGTVAQLTASRVALKPLRRMRVFSADCYASLDFSDGQRVC